MIEALVTERLDLQPLTGADAEDLVALLDEHDLREWLGSDNVDALRERFTRWERRRSPDGDEEWLNWTARRRDGGAAVGWVQATLAGHSAEIAYALLAPARGRGYAVEAVAAMVDWLRSARGAESVEAHIAPANTASAAVATAVGLHATEEMDDGEQVWR